MHQTLAPLTGEDWEWNDVTEYNDGKTLFQNNRDSRVFKNSLGQALFLDGVVFKGNIGGGFTGTVTLKSGESFSSRQFIKSFPFDPKTFCVDVIDFRWKDKEELIPDDNGVWWTHELKDESQLIPVFEYYGNPKVN
jgi:hypothetical protein